MYAGRVNSLTVEREIELKCFFGSVRMCMLIAKVASLFDSKIMIFRGDEACSADSPMDLMIVGRATPDNCVPFRVVKVSASGPDASAAVEAIIGLFPSDGVPERCNLPGCKNPAVLLGPVGKDGFYYRCTIDQFDKQHNWTVAG
jgi:phosphotransferase system HPr-like phosphotransfer protein